MCLKKFCLPLFYLLLVLAGSTTVIRAQLIVDTRPSKNSFSLSANSLTAICIDEADYSLINKSAVLLQQDIEKVIGSRPALIYNPLSAKRLILIGSVDKSGWIQKLAKDKKIKVDNIKGKWEAYSIQVVKRPFAGVDEALVIAGSDRRGTAYGVFELSKQMGVSPWYWWADVPVVRRNTLYINADVVIDKPGVKYRGIFINDEAPALSGWTKEKFGGFNHLFYEKVFELILRLKGNYLWPAMWGNAFYDDDSLDIKSADEYGIVIGTSHHEPLMRAHVEWKRYGSGKWNYDSNEVKLKDFWRTGIQRATNEKIVSIGMRGDGDEPMTRETATALLERIVKDQREIIEEVTGKPATETPQLWALYKEVQDYYDKGMRVPDDVTLLLCDDNWGNIRKLPKIGEKPRKGGYGIYYHFDYVGDPRNYKWINTNNIARVWEQMHLAWEYNARHIWIVNVGDIKPMEYPISFFLDYAWNPERMDADDLKKYSITWAARQFGQKQAIEVGEILQKYSQYASRRKPELLDEKTYDLAEHNEFGNVVADWIKLRRQAEKINSGISKEYRDAFYQLVLHPVEAFANLHEMYLNVALNHASAKDSCLSANRYADYVKQLYKNDSLLTLQYHAIANGKWNHLMDQTHIGYTYWQQPPENKIPELFYLTDGAACDTTQNPNYKELPGKKLIPETLRGNIFYQDANYVSMEAAHYTKANSNSNARFKIITGIGRDGDGITLFPVAKLFKENINDAPRLEYEFYSYGKDSVRLHAYFSPTLNFQNTAEGLQFAVSIDEEQPQVISLNKDDRDVNTWMKWVAGNIIIRTSSHFISKPGKHVLKFRMISPAIILQKLVIDFGGLKPGYLGPPETRRE